MCGDKQAFRAPPYQYENPVICRIRKDLENDPRLSDAYREIVMEIVKRDIREGAE